MKSPFAIFRKHQKVLMVVLTGLAMFAFVVLDSLTQNMAAAPPVFGFMLGLGIAWALTRNTKTMWVWLLVGGVAGGLLGSRVQQSTVASEAIVTTSFGAMTTEDLQLITERRQKVNGFLIEAFRKAHEGEENPPTFVLQQSLFGGRTDPMQEALMHSLLMKEAKKLEIDISQNQMTQFIDQATSNKLSGPAFGKILSQLRLSSGEFFNLLREQMIAQEAQRILTPNLLASPDDYWDAFRKLNVRQELAVVPLAREAFLPLVGEPTEDQLKELFEAHKDEFPNESAAGSPGFRQPGRIKLGYLELDYDTVAKTIPEIAEAEIKQYYEKNREEFRNNVTPDFPETPAENGTPAPAGAAPESSSGPALMLPETTPATPETPAATPTTETAPAKPAVTAPEKTEENAEPAQPEATKPAAEKPAAEEKAPATEKPAEPTPEAKPAPEAETPKTPATEEQSSRLMGPLGNAFASIQDEAPAQPAPATEEKPTEEKPEAPASETPANPTPAPETPATEQPKPEEKPASTPAPAAEKTGGEKAEPAAQPAGEAAPAMTPPETPPAAAPAEKLPEFKPLDDVVKAQIREQLKDQKTRAKLADLAQQARGHMINLNSRYAAANDKEKPQVATEIQAEAKKYAQANGMRYVETPYLSPEELEESEDHPIGHATEPVANPFERANARTVIEQHLNVADLESLVRQRYALNEAEDSSTLNRFIHWQIDYKDSHVPTWEDKGVREQVLTAWKKLEAEKLAEKRAEEIAKMLRETDQPWADVLAEKTETGKEGSQSLIVSYTGEFSWVTRSTAPQTNPFAPPPMEITQIPIILGGTNNKFMETVFQDLQNGEIGTVWSANRNYVFVVRVDNRTDIKKVQADFMGPQANLFSFFSPYEMLTRSDAQAIVNAWTENLFERYQVQWKEE